MVSLSFSIQIPFHQPTPEIPSNITKQHNRIRKAAQPNLQHVWTKPDIYHPAKPIHAKIKPILNL